MAIFPLLLGSKRQWERKVHGPCAFLEMFISHRCGDRPSRPAWTELSQLGYFNPAVCFSTIVIPPDTKAVNANISSEGDGPGCKPANERTGSPKEPLRYPRIWEPCHPTC